IAGHTNINQLSQVIYAYLSALLTFFADSPEHIQVGNKSLHPTRNTLAPGHTGLRTPYRYTYANNSRAHTTHSSLYLAAVPNHPAHIRGGTEHVTELHIVHNFHAVTHGHGMVTVITHNAFGLAGGTGGVEYIERVITPYRSAIGRLRPGNRL